VRKIRATFAPDDPGAAHSLFRGPLGRHDRIISAARGRGKQQKAHKLLKLLLASRSVIRNKTHQPAGQCFPVASQFLPDREAVSFDREVLPPMPRLTPQQVSALTLPLGKTDACVFDDVVPGLAIRLRAGGKKSWVFQYRVGTKQRRLTLGAATALTPHDARKQAARLHAEVKLGHDPAGDKDAARARANETFAAVLPLFLGRQKERLRPRAFIEVERHLNVHAKRLHHLPLAGVARRDVAGVLTTTAARLSNASANRVRTSLSAFFTWSIREGLLDSNPAAWTERREESVRRRLLTDGELREIWASLRDDAYGAVARLLILTGARREEVGALRWSEVDLDQGLITLTPERTKNKRGHEIVLSSPALSILRSRTRLSWPDGSPCDLVFGRGARGFADWVCS
jgi:hypothetical protein